MLGKEVNLVVVSKLLCGVSIQLKIGGNVKMEIKLPKGLRGQAYQEALEEFAKGIIELDRRMEYKVSARGWCYLMEGMNLITKDQFNYVEKTINTCRREGLIPLDFTATDKRRDFQNVDILQRETKSPKEYINGYLRWIQNCHKYKDDVAFWETQKYYIQMAVEKVDVLNLFSELCEKYHIPIANMVGWSDMNSRGDMAQRFKEAEEDLGLKPVLLYYGDFDPAGILIADFLKENLDQLKKATHWNPENLIVDRFGLTIEFINENTLTWIDNLITSGKRDIGKLYNKHVAGTLTKKDTLYPYEIEYIEKYGVRKCEANAILPIPDIAKKHCEDKILEYLGKDCFDRYDKAIKTTQEETKNLMQQVNYQERITTLMNDLSEVEHIFTPDPEFKNKF